MINISPISLPVQRRAVVYTNGVAQETITETTVMAGVQPYDDTGDTQSDLVLSREAILITSADELLAASDSAPADIVTYRLRKYVVRSSRYWECVIPHYEVIAELVDG